MHKMVGITILVAFLLACQNRSKGTQNDPALVGTQKVETSSAKDYFSAKVDVQYAQKFSVTYHKNYKVVRTSATLGDRSSSNGEAQDIEDVMVLVQRGTNPPVIRDSLPNATIIYVPAGTVAVNVQHSESYLREIGLENRIAAIGGLYSYNDKMREKALEGTVGQIGYSWHSPPNFEVLLKRKPEVFLMTMASLDHKESLDKCRQLGIPTAAVFDWAESDYLARAEWIKFYALFFNAEKEANQVFENIADKIKTLKSITQSVALKESALWGFYTSKQRWKMHINSIPAQYMVDAGLKNVLLDNTKANADGAQTLTTEELLLKGKDVEHWVIGDIHAGPLPKESIMNNFEAWRTGNLYHNMERIKPKENASDWYAKAIVRPDIVLEDLIRLVYPQLLPDHSLVFMGHYNKVTEGPPIN
ncbi:ABC transporter substrate-binding protein [Ulvibacterium sp.]|uniref:ABC transporter substrate-binding protein n=1 Tax=Ulvibacterium sp. TaxID=2665914 RepID=UPI00261FFD94|nr:ABC transporter substrate-binding protein [Ulvibacterium sp.]